MRDSFSFICSLDPPPRASENKVMSVMLGYVWLCWVMSVMLGYVGYVGYVG